MEIEEKDEKMSTLEFVIKNSDSWRVFLERLGGNGRVSSTKGPVHSTIIRAQAQGHTFD